jgi:hypothetical protein
MNKIIHFFDLDGTLWNIHSRAWLIDKNNPGKPLIILSQKELTEILNGVYKKDDLLIEYNGTDYWISKELLKRIQKKKKYLTEEEIGISFQEMSDPQYYKDLTIYKENFRHLIGQKDITIGILSARSSEENDEQLLIKLKEELENMGLDIKKLFYVSEFFNIRRSADITAFKKMNVILEHLVGFKIKDDHFQSVKQDFYNEIHFYDDEFKNIQIIDHLQENLEKYLKDTDDEVFDRIIKRIKEFKPVVYTHLITNNQLNKFKTSKVELKIPEKFPVKIEESFKYIKKFKEFINEN